MLCFIMFVESCYKLDIDGKNVKSLVKAKQHLKNLVNSMKTKSVLNKANFFQNEFRIARML